MYPRLENAYPVVENFGSAFSIRGALKTPKGTSCTIVGVGTPTRQFGERRPDKGTGSRGTV
jgi:hypothetical protein